MLLKTNSTICALRPLRAGGVLVRSLAGISLRNNAIPLRNVSHFAQSNKQSFFRTAQLIRSLSPGQIADWQTARFRYHWYTPCGDMFFPEVPELFFSLNIPCFNFGLSPFSEPPASTDFEPISGFLFLEVTDYSMVISYIGGPIPNHTILQLFAAPPSFSPNPDNYANYIFIGSFPDSTLQSFSIFNEYFAKFGQPVPGSYVRLAARLFTIDSGLFSPMFYNSSIVS